MFPSEIYADILRKTNILNKSRIKVTKAIIPLTDKDTFIQWIETHRMYPAEESSVYRINGLDIEFKDVEQVHVA